MLTDRQTNKQTNTGENITSLAEVKASKITYPSTHYRSFRSLCIQLHWTPRKIQGTNTEKKKQPNTYTVALVKEKKRLS